METPLIALQELGRPVRHLFSSETDEAARKVIQEHFRPDALFEDAVSRSARALPADLDIYVAGFPCQRFSKLRAVGAPGGDSSGDSSDPLMHFKSCLRAIRRCRPRIFVLENVPAFRSYDGGRVFLRASSLLGKLRNYHVSVMVLDSRQYGSPQMRKRLFIVGLRKDRAAAPLPAPKAEGRVPFMALMQRRAAEPSMGPAARKDLQRCLRRKPPGDFFLELAWGLRGCQFTKEPPTLLAHAAGGLYSSELGRRTSRREDMRLQGIPDSFSFPEGVGECAGRRLVGNAISVGVLKSLLAACLAATRT